MKKKIAIAMAALMLVLSAAGCGQQTADNKTQGKSEKNTTRTDASGAYEQSGSADGEGQVDAEIEDYSELIDMDKVDGEEMTSETAKGDYKGKLGDVEVEIGDAKVIEYNGEQVAVVSFEYTNHSDVDTPFTGAIKVEATQDENRLTPTVVYGVDGVTMIAMTENVKKGDTITVQTAYRLRDNTTPLVITVNEFIITENSSEGISKTFEF